MSKIQINSTQIKSLSLKNEQIATDAAISLSKIDGGVELQNAVSDLQNDAFVTREVPSGAVDGSNVTFTLANSPVAGSEQVYLNGLLQDPGEGNSYTISGGTITFASAPLSGDEIHVSYATGDYMVAPGGSGGSGGAGAIEIFQDEEFIWTATSDGFNRDVTHNKGRKPDFVVVYTQVNDIWTEELKYYVNSGNRGWYDRPDVGVDGSNVCRLTFFQHTASYSGVASIPTRVRLYWLSSQDIGTASAGNVAGLGGGSGSSSTKYTTQVTHTGSSSGTAYTLNHNLGTTDIRIDCFYQNPSTGNYNKLVDYDIDNAGNRYGTLIYDITSTSLTVSLYRFYPTRPGIGETSTLNVRIVVTPL